MQFLGMMDGSDREREKGGMLWFSPGASMWWNYFRMGRGSAKAGAASSVGSAARGAAAARMGYGTINTKQDDDSKC